jgi:hypothetical protein
MGRRPKLVFKPNLPMQLKMLFDDCVEGISYGKPYALFAVEYEGQEFALFADPEVVEHLKPLKKGQSIIVTKKAKASGNRVLFNYNFSSPTTIPNLKANVPHEPVPISEVIPQILPDLTDPNIEFSTEEQTSEPAQDKLFSIMRKSCIQAMELNSELNGMLNPERIAITLFIAKTKNLSS